MLNFSGIANSGIVGKALRFPLRLIPRDSVVRVLQGPLRGKKWIAGSSNHGCWLGSYEHSKQQLFQQKVSTGSVVLDVGANVGFYTLLASVLVGDSGKVFAIEPLPSNPTLLKRHVALNRLKNVTVIDGAASDRSGIASFAQVENNCMGKLSSDGNLVVKTFTIDDLIAQGIIAPPTIVKIDVEGAEGEVLRGAEQTLRTHLPKMFLATHGKEIHRYCCEFLQSLGYTLTGIDNSEFSQTDEVFAHS